VHLQIQNCPKMQISTNAQILVHIRYFMYNISWPVFRGQRRGLERVELK